MAIEIDFLSGQKVIAKNDMDTFDHMCYIGKGTILTVKNIRAHIDNPKSLDEISLTFLERPGYMYPCPNFQIYKEPEAVFSEYVSKLSQIE